MTAISYITEQAIPFEKPVFVSRTLSKELSKKDCETNTLKKIG